jgi:hypothetical protein
MSRTLLPVLAGPVVLVSSLTTGCGSSPTVALPNTNAALYGPQDAGAVPTPVPEQVASPYPYSVVPVRGVAPQAVTVILDINGASNPIAVAVSQLDGTFCAEVPMPAPAQFDIAITSQAGDARTSASQAHVEFVYDPTAPDLPGLTLCQGERPHR